MANRLPRTDTQMNWSDNTWADNVSGPWNLSPPQDGDTATFHDPGCNVVMDTDSGHLATLGMFTGTLDIKNHTLTTDSVVAFGSAGLLKAGLNGAGGTINVMVSNFVWPHSIELDGDLYINAAFLSSCADIDTGPYDIILDGILRWDAGGVTTCNMVVTGGHNVQWNTSDSANRLTSFRVRNGTFTKVGHVYTRKLTVDSGATLAGSQDIKLYEPIADDYIDIQGLFTTGGLYLYLTDYDNSGRIALSSGCEFRCFGIDTEVVWSGEMDVPKIWLFGASGTAATQLHFTCQYVSLGAVKLGYAGQNRPGKINLYKTAKIASIILDAGAVADSCEVNLHSCQLALTGTFTGTGIVVTADGDKVHIINPIGGSGRLTDVESNNKVHAHDCIVDVDCLNISDDTEVYPSSKVLMGAGI